MKHLLVLSLLLVGGSSSVYDEDPPESLADAIPIEVIPYYDDVTPAGLGCLRLSAISHRWHTPQEHENWGTPLPEMDYCGYNPEGLRICCPK